MPTCKGQRQMDPLVCVNGLMLQFREFVVELEEEEKELERKLARLRSRQANTLPDTIRSNSRRQPTIISSADSIETTVNTASPTYEPSATNTTSTAVQSVETANSSSSGATRPPSYKSVVKPPAAPLEVPKPPARIRRRNTIQQLTNTLRNLNLTMATNGVSRGALIVLEGLDRVGKSTLATKLVEHLERTRRPVSFCRFPDRSTPVGKLIDEFLRNGSKKVDDHTMHLLFSANRWELHSSIRNSLKQGTTVVVDRYSYSGIAYSSAKSGLNLDWCRESEKGLPKPDLVIYLELPKEAQYRRAGFGEERFETKELQELVRSRYSQLIAMSKEQWVRVDVENKSPDEILGEIIVPVKRCLESCGDKELGDLDFH